jgi:tetratricopeptide (TPR) repeat protein
MAGILLNRNRQVPAEQTPAFGGIAERFRRAGDLDRAVALCREGLKRFPEQLSARVTLGWALLDKGQYDAAREELEQVLRRAPDNLAAIRGLAELHDRSEGAISAAEQESWRAPETAAEPPVTEIVAAADPARLAPIQVALSAGASDDAPDLLQSPAAAELEAAGAGTTAEVLAPEPTPVELEDPAAASMAAVTEPSPFFVVAPEESADSTEAEAPTVAFEAFDAAALGTLQAADAALDVVAGSSIDLSVEPSDEALLAAAAALEEKAELEAAGLVAGVHEQEHVVFDAVAAVDTEPTWGSAAWDATPTVDEVEAMPVEALEDVDEEAGAELADAIKALEAAARRVEKKLAPPPASIEPAASPEDIAAFEFFERAQEGEDLTAPSSLVDVQRDGSFELVAPDLASVELETPADAALDVVAELETAADAVAPYSALLAFDTPEGAAASPATEVDASADTVLPEPAAAAESVITTDADFAGAISLEHPDSASGLATDATLTFTSASEVDADVSVSDLQEALNQSNAEAVASESYAITDESAAASDLDALGEAEVAADVQAFETLVETSDVQSDDVSDDDEPPPASNVEAEAPRLVPFEVVRTQAIAADAVSDIAGDSYGAADADSELNADATAVEVVGDQPEGDAVSVDVALAALSATDTVAPMAGVTSALSETALAIGRRQKTIAALERFLRQVQARQLALQSETVA